MPSPAHPLSWLQLPPVSVKTSRLFFFFFNRLFLGYNLFIYFYFLNLFLAALGLCGCARAFSSCGEWGPLFLAVRGLLIAVASLVEEHGL